MREWKKTGDFSIKDAYHSRFLNFQETDCQWHSAEMFPLYNIGKEQYRWVLVINLRGCGYQKYSDGARYVIGQYDGSKFVAFGEEVNNHRYLDYGSDFTSLSTFFDFGLNPAKRTGLAWLSSSHYYTSLPTKAFRG